MASIRDVARKANVSPATVSRILNQDQTLSVGEETRARVLKAAAELDYHLETNKKRKKKQLTLVQVTTVRKIDESDDPYYRDIRKGMLKEAALKKMAFEQIIDVKELIENQELIKAADVVTTLGTLDHEALEQISQWNQNIIVIDDPKVDEKYDVVYINLIKETRKSLDLLKAKGHKKIAFIGGYENRRGPQGTVSTAEEIRFETYLRWMKEEGLGDDIRYQLGEWMPLSGYEMAKRILEDGQLPTAILTASDPLAIGAYRAFQEEGIRIPQDVAIVSFDDIDITKFLTPALTTISFPAEELGMVVVRLAAEKATQERQTALRIALPAELVIRESV